MEKIHNGLKGIGRYYRLTNAKKFLKGKTLDVGCSDGAFLALCKDKQIKGIEIEKELVEKSSKWGDATLASGEEIPFPDKSFDTVTCLDVLEHMDNKEKALKEIQRIAKQRIILSYPRRPFEGHPGFIKEIINLPGYKIIHKKYLIPVMRWKYKGRTFNNEKHMDEFSGRFYYPIFKFFRPLIILGLSFIGKFDKSALLIVYDKIN